MSPTVLNSVIRFCRLVGVDRPIAYTIAGRGWSVVAGPITFVCLATFLSPEEQGFYYTFNSVIGLQIFVELGLTWVIVHFASHEHANLRWAPDGTLEGDASAKGRLSSMFKAAAVWYSIAGALMVLVVLPCGFAFLGTDPSAARVSWRSPWTLLVLLSAGSLILSPYFAILEGCGLIGTIAWLRLWQGVSGSIVLWLALSQQCRLFTAPLNAAVTFSAAAVWLFISKRKFFVDLLTTRGSGNLREMWRELWPMQWRIAVSWMSSYAIFQLFAPVLFAFHGAIPAGQMGMSVNMVMAISMTAIAWVTTKAAPFGTLIARRQFSELDAMFFSSLWRSSVLLLFAGAAFWCFALHLRLIHHPWAERLLDLRALAVLLVAALAQHVVGAEAIYLRAHKKEPFLVVSILSALAMAPSTYLLGRSGGATGMMIGYLAVVLIIGLGLGTYIFVTKRRLWHQPLRAAAV